VELCYEGEWIAGTVRALPERDTEGKWAVQCDADEEGIWTFSSRIRPARESSNRPAQAQPLSTGSASVSASSSSQAGQNDVGSILRVTGADGIEYIVALDNDGNELGSFCHTHINFELSASKEDLDEWLEKLDSRLLYALLSLLSDELASRKLVLDDLKEKRAELYAVEDYVFFGLDADATWQDVVRAYRRLSAQLHPDKGGDEAAFADMRQRYDRIRALHNKRQMESRANYEQEDEGAVFDGDGTMGGSNDIEWDPQDRESMLTAHQELHLQLVWLTNEVRKLEVDIESVRSRHGVPLSSSAGMQRTSASAVAPVIAMPPPPVHTASELASCDGAGEMGGVSAPQCSGDYPSTGIQHMREELGVCLLCLEPLPTDPREVVNLCGKEEGRCLCLLHRACFLDPQSEMSDQLRRCMICKAPADADLVRQAVKARAARIQQ